MPMTPEQFGRFMQADIATLGEARAANATSPWRTERWHATRRSRRTTTRRRSPARSRSSSPRIPRGAGATPSTTRRTAPSSTGWAAPWAPRATRRRRPPWMPPPCCSRRRSRPSWAARERVDMASAALVNGITSHTLRLRRHAPQDDHPPGGPGRLGDLRAGGNDGRLGPAAHRRAGARHRRLVPARQRDVPGPLRPGLAHHRLDGDARRGGRVRAAPRPRRGAHRHGAGHRRLAAGGHARAVRHDDQALPSRRRGARGTALGAAREARVHREPQGHRGAARLRAGRLHQVRLEGGHRRAGPALRDLLQHLQALRLRHRDPSLHRRLRAAARARACGRRTSSASSSRCIRWCWSSRARRSRRTGCRASSASTTAAPRGSSSAAPARPSTTTPSSAART